MRSIFRFGTLKSRMAVVVVALVFVATSLVAISSLYLAEQKMRATLGNQQIALLSSAATTIAKDLTARKMLLELLATQISSAELSPPLAMQTLLESHGLLRDEFSTVVVLNNSGDVIANLQDRRAIGKLNVRDRAYFQDTLRAKEGLVSDPFKSKLSGKPVVVITAPVFDQAGALTYILVGGIDLQKPRSFGQLESLQPGQTGYLFMITGDGTIIQHPDQTRLLKRVTEEPGGAVPSTLAAMRGFEGWTYGANKRGVSAIITYKRLYSTNWILGSVYPIKEAFTPMIETRTSAMLASIFVAAVAGLVGWLAILWLLRPLSALRKHIWRTHNGGDINVFAVDREDEFGELSRAFHSLSAQRAEFERDLQAVARTDALTGLSNRRMFEEVLAAAIARASRAQTTLALAYLDIDHFKAINDTYGHAVGDSVLTEFANRLRSAVRASDTVARLGGDEFVVVFEQLSERSPPEALGNMILESMATPFTCAELTISVTTSIGLAVDMRQTGTPASMLETADASLYAAKANGRNRYVIRTLAGQPGLY